MSWLFPLGLLALISLPLILLLHLMRERRRRVVIPSLLIWQLLPRREEAQKRRRLPFSLLLLLQLIAAALLSAAIGGPLWALNLRNDRNLVVIIDTSVSMAARDPRFGNAPRLDAARERARQLIAALRPSDQAALISAGPQARLIADLGTPSAVLALLDSIGPEGVGADVEGAILIAQATLADAQAENEVVALTDSALPDLPPTLNSIQLNAPLRWENVGGALDNRAVVTLSARPDAGGSYLFARVANFGGNAHGTQVRLFGDDQLLDTRESRLGPNSEEDFTWRLPRGVEVVRVEIDGGDGLSSDDQSSLSLRAARPLRALLVSNTPFALERALRAVPNLEVQVLAPSAYAAQPLEADLSIFDGVIPGMWPTGGVLVLNPPRNDGGLLPVIDSSRPRDDAVLAPNAAELLDGLSLASVDFGNLANLPTPEWASVALALGEQPVILRGRVERSEIAVWTFDLNQSNFPERLAFPLLVARTVADLTPTPFPGSLAVGSQITLRAGPRATSVELIAPNGDIERFNVSDGPIRLISNQVGTYTVVEKRESEILFTGAFAANAGIPAEVNLQPRPLPQLVALPQRPTLNQESAATTPLWPWLIAAALIVIILEWLAAHSRRFSATGGR